MTMKTSTIALLHTIADLEQESEGGIYAERKAVFEAFGDTPEVFYDAKQEARSNHLIGCSSLYFWLTHKGQDYVNYSG